MTEPNSLGQDGEDLCTDTTSDVYTSKITSDTDTSPAMCVVAAVSDALGTDIEELEVLYDAIDPDALNRFIESPHQFTEGRIQFRYAGCDVTVDADGSIAVSPRMTDEE